LLHALFNWLFANPEHLNMSSSKFGVLGLQCDFRSTNVHCRCQHDDGRMKKWQFKVIITTLAEIPPGTKPIVGVPITLQSGYLSPTPYGASINFTVVDATSRKEAINKALDQLIELADEIKQGAISAKSDLGT
jgi:hypothetical protein